MVENTAKFAGGSMIKIRYKDLISKKETTKETKSGGEIVTDIVSRAGLEII